MSDRPGSPILPLVELGGIGKTFDGVTVLRDVALTVRPGQVHALLGGNGSGKSTTLKILAGVHTADDGGTITLAGQPHATAGYTPAVAAAGGLRFVHQDLGLVHQHSISENFALASSYPRTPVGGIAWAQLHRETAAALARQGVDLDPRTPVAALTASQRTAVAIARALRDSDTGTPRALVLDEPTASLPAAEVAGLLTALRGCRDRGHGIVYVSHRIPEVLALADVVTVLRDGAVVHSGPVAGLDEDAVVELMTGTATEHTAGTRPAADVGEPVLEVHGLTGPGLGPVDLTAHAGEVVGVAGLVGSGRSRLLHALAGSLQRTGGEVVLAGRPTRHRHPAAAMADGIVLVPEDRARQAAFADRPLWENVSAMSYRRYRRPWGFARRAERRDAGARATRHGVRAAHAGVPFATLSGGNQQKAVLARVTWPDPRVLLLDEPSQGVDVMARREIHRLVREHVAGGRAALVVSSDFAELADLCDRVLVLHAGRVVHELTGGRLTEESIARAALSSKETST